MESICLLCPFCGQENQLEVDTSISRQRFVTDCEVCCHPFEVVASCDHGELVEVEALAN